MKRILCCDLDGTLMPPSSGLFVSEALKQKLIELQQQGAVVILNSARIFQGVLPLAKQIRMDKYHGVIVSSNGCHIWDVQEQKTLFSVAIGHEEVRIMAEAAASLHLGFGFAQPEAFICNSMQEGFALDQKNCDIDYIVTDHFDRYLRNDVVKCALAGSKEELERAADAFEALLRDKTNCILVRSTPTLYDIIRKGTSKHQAVSTLLEHLGCSWQDVYAIGDGNSDAQDLRAARVGCTLENGTDLCKQAADRIVPSVYEEGALVWFDEIQRGIYENNRSAL